MSDPTPSRPVTRSMVSASATGSSSSQEEQQKTTHIPFNKQDTTLIQEEEGGEEETTQTQAPATATGEQEQTHTPMQQARGEEEEEEEGEGGEEEDGFVDIPESPSAVGTTAMTTRTGLRKARRKLSVMSDNHLVDGIHGIHIDDTLTQNGTHLPCIVSAYAGATRKGFAPYNMRKKNQDALIMAEEAHTATIMFCVLDGHGEYGELVSGFFQRELSKAVFAHDCFVADPRRAFLEVLPMLEARLLRDPHVDCDFSGTTMVCVMLRGEQMWVFNCGDSRATMGVVEKEIAEEEEEAEGAAAAGEEGEGEGTTTTSIPKPTPTRAHRTASSTSFPPKSHPHPHTHTHLTALPLSIDHKPDLPVEKARILASGGRVFAVRYDDGEEGPARVWLSHMDVPGLAMSRSLGDAVAHSVGVSSEVEVVERVVDPGMEPFVIVATDGLWEFVSDEDAVAIVCKYGKDPQQAVDALIKEANVRWLREEQVVDDTTVCVAFLGGWAAHSQTYTQTGQR